MTKNSDWNLAGKTALVTGGAGLLGPHIGMALAEAGANVILCDINPSSGRKTLSDIPTTLKPRVRFQILDVTKESSIKKVLKAVERRNGGVDILINAAIASGTTHFTSVEKYDMHHWNRVMEVNVNGTFLMTRNVAASMIRKDIRGSIINIASIYGVVGADQRIYGNSGINSPAVYAASKGAIVNLTRYFAAYWAKNGLRINCVSPGGVFNDQPQEFLERYASKTPLGRMMDRKEIKGAVLYLASNASSFVTGHNIMVDGGWTAW